jgi:hypothetical protein
VPTARRRSFAGPNGNQVHCGPLYARSASVVEGRAERKRPLIVVAGSVPAMRTTRRSGPRCSSTREVRPTSGAQRGGASRFKSSASPFSSVTSSWRSRARSRPVRAAEAPGPFRVHRILRGAMGPALLRGG